MDSSWLIVSVMCLEQLFELQHQDVSLSTIRGANSLVLFFSSSVFPKKLI